MADFPSKVTTETSTQNYQNSQQGVSATITTMVDFSFIRSMQGILMMVEIVMVYNGVATVLFLTAFIANAATVSYFKGIYSFGSLGAAAFFGAVMTLLYGASAFFSYLDWRGNGGNAADSTVPT
uniref:Plasmolipin n=1 Tax=Oryzias latipes TaxID=8090 RepID=A0A3P9H3F5_ORYLA